MSVPLISPGTRPGHTGYLFGEGDETVLFWGDTVHCHSCSCEVRR